MRCQQKRPASSSRHCPVAPRCTSPGRLFCRLTQVLKWALLRDPTPARRPCSSSFQSSARPCVASSSFARPALASLTARRDNEQKGARGEKAMALGIDLLHTTPKDQRENAILMKSCKVVTSSTRQTPTSKRAGLVVEPGEDHIQRIARRPLYGLM
jgi:hypothetical protein